MAELSYYDILAKLVSVAKGFSNEIYINYPVITSKKRGFLEKSLSEGLGKRLEMPLTEFLIQNDDTVKNHINVYMDNLIHMYEENKKINNGSLKGCTQKDIAYIILDLMSGFNVALADRIETIKTNGYTNKSPLNNNWNDCGLKLYPRYGAYWEHTRKGKQRGLEYTHLISNFWDCTNSNKDGYTFNNVFGRIDYQKRLLPIKKDRELTIGMSGVSNLPAFKIDLGEDKEKYIFNVELERDLETKIIEVFKKACEEKVDILIFPEMLGSENINKKLKQIIRKMSLLGKRLPILTITPTKWENNINELIVYDCEAFSVLKQKKLVPYEHQVNGKIYIENIKLEKDVNILHIEGLGRILFPICKTFINPVFETLTKDIKPTLILCPSYSPKDYDFKVNAETLAKIDCNLSWCNCCEAVLSSQSKNKCSDVEEQTLCTEKRIIGFTTQHGNIYEEKNSLFEIPNDCLLNRKFKNEECSKVCFQKHYIKFEEGK